MLTSFSILVPTVLLAAWTFRLTLSAVYHCYQSSRQRPQVKIHQAKNRHNNRYSSVHVRGQPPMSGECLCRAGVAAEDEHPLTIIDRATRAAKSLRNIFNWTYTRNVVSVMGQIAVHDFVHGLQLCRTGCMSGTQFIVKLLQKDVVHITGEAMKSSNSPSEMESLHNYAELGSWPHETEKLMGNFTYSLWSQLDTPPSSNEMAKKAPEKLLMHDILMNHRQSSYPLEMNHAEVDTAELGTWPHTEEELPKADSFGSWPPSSSKIETEHLGKWPGSVAEDEENRNENIPISGPYFSENPFETSPSRTSEGKS